MALRDGGAGGARLEQAQRVRLRLFHGFEAVDQLVRCLAEHNSARDLRVESAGPIVLD